MAYKRKQDSGGYGRHATTEGGRTTGSKRKPRQPSLRPAKISKLPSKAEKATARARQEAIEAKDRQKAARRKSRATKTVTRKKEKPKRREWGSTELGEKAERQVTKFAKKTFGRLKKMVRNKRYVKNK